MGAQIKIDTETVAGVASRLDGYNNTIEAQYASMKSAVNSMYGEWNSPGGTRAMDRINKVLKMADQRKDVLDQYTKTLQMFINPAYLAAEDTNTSLADQFD